MSTLNFYRKRAGYKSVRAFTEAAQQAGVALRWSFYERPFTLSIASQWLQGHFREDIKPEDQKKLLALLHIREEEYFTIAQESRLEGEARWRIKHPSLTKEQLDQVDAERKAWCDARIAQMTDAEKQQIHREALRLGIVQPERRSPMDILIDKACGIE